LTWGARIDIIETGIKILLDLSDDLCRRGFRENSELY
jgi:hypothetical protein